MFCPRTVWKTCPGVIVCSADLHRAPELTSITDASCICDPHFSQCFFPAEHIQEGAHMGRKQPGSRAAIRQLCLQQNQAGMCWGRVQLRARCSQQCSPARAVFQLTAS